MQMIPQVFMGPSAGDIFLPTFLEHDTWNLDEIDQHSSFLEYETISPSNSDFDPSVDLFDYVDHDESDPQRYSKFLLSDCKWTGCDTECAKTHNRNISLDDEASSNELLCSSPPEWSCVKVKEEVQPYTPDSDHCYYALPPKQVVNGEDDIQNIPTPPSTSESTSETSSEDEVDVVTVPEEYELPVIAHNFGVPRRNTRSQRSLKKTQKPQPVSAKSLKAAMKRTKMQNTCRTYKRRKVTNSVQQLTPSSSIPSSAQSSRCSSDVEDLDKRENHNVSERKRREIQRTNLQVLRIQIPELENNPKASKVVILNSAANLVAKLKQSERMLLDLKKRELQRQKDLTAKLNRMHMELKKCNLSM